jgi:hypothetical protein
VKAEKRFKRANLSKDASNFRDKHREVMDAAKRQRLYNAPLSPAVQAFADRVRAAASQGASTGAAAAQPDHQPAVIVDIPQNL